MVEYKDSLIRKLEQSLKSAFKQPLLSLNREEGKRGPEIRITLAYGTTTARTDDGTEYAVCEILTEGDRRSTFWFGFVAVFTQIELKRYGLHHASLLVFHDIENELVPLFRAEWDREAASEKKSKHAQPHWHFMQHPRRIERLIRALISPADVQEFVADPEGGLFDEIPDCGRIHFAMTSLWEKSETPPYIKRQFDSTDFPKWFDNLTHYIADQIAYIVKHTSRSLLSEVQAFVPTTPE